MFAIDGKLTATYDGIARRLLAAPGGCAVNALSLDDQTALLLAFEHFNLDLVPELLDAGAALALLDPWPPAPLQGLEAVHARPVLQCWRLACACFRAGMQPMLFEGTPPPEPWLHDPFRWGGGTFGRRAECLPGCD